MCKFFFPRGNCLERRKIAREPEAKNDHLKRTWRKKRGKSPQNDSTKLNQQTEFGIHKANCIKLNLGINLITQFADHVNDQVSPIKFPYVRIAVCKQKTGAGKATPNCCLWVAVEMWIADCCLLPLMQFVDVFSVTFPPSRALHPAHCASDRLQ